MELSILCFRQLKKEQPRRSPDPTVKACAGPELTTSYCESKVRHQRFKNLLQGRDCKSLSVGVHPHLWAVKMLQRAGAGASDQVGRPWLGVQSSSHPITWAPNLDGRMQCNVLT